MPRSARTETDAPDHDSFLDIVANMVGILIILVMVVGVRVKNAPVAAIKGPTQRVRSVLEEELEKTAATEKSVRRDVWAVAEQVEAVKLEAIIRRRQRHMVAMQKAALEEQIESQRRQMDAQSRDRFDLKRSLSEMQSRLESLDGRQRQVEAAKTAPTVLESYPTPLSKTVDENEVHLQLLGGRIVPIPVGELTAKLKSDFQRKTYRLLNQTEITGTVGPVGGFRMKYTMRRHDMTPEMALATGRTGSFVRLQRWTLVPTSSRLGEPVEEALDEGSELRRALSKLRPGRDTITVWTYPDSFAAFRTLKKSLYHQGFSVAARPLPEGYPIAGSPDGSKSAAQ